MCNTEEKNMKKTRGIFFVAAVLCFLLMSSLVIAAPPGSQPPSSSNQVPVVFPDLRNVDVAIQADTYPDQTKPNAGDQVRIYCGYQSCGCFGNKLFWNKIDIDGALFYEKEGAWVAGGSNNPNACAPENCFSYAWPIADKWKATPGSHTITCIVDSKDNIYEGLPHEQNNAKSITVNVTLPKSAIDKMKDIKTKPPIPPPTPGVR
jgi:hypothetical protein